MLVAEEEDYDIFGIYFLGFTAAFGGGLIRNLLIGIPIENFWLQNYLFEIAFLAITIVFVLFCSINTITIYQFDLIDGYKGYIKEFFFNTTFFRDNIVAAFRKVNR